MNIITLAEAKAAGLTRYFTGEPCKHGHIVERLVSNRQCVECHRAVDRKHREGNPEKARERSRVQARKRYRANPEKARELVRAWRAANPEKVREYTRRYNRAFTEEVREKRRVALRKLYAPLAYAHRPCPVICECCGKPPKKRALNLDHNHKTGEFRGWLCDLCNTAIGKLGDNLDGVRRAVAYLERAHAEALV